MEFHYKEIVVCEATRKNLRYILLWPGKCEEINPGKYYYIKVALFCLITSMLYGSISMHFILTLKNNLDLYISEDIAVIVSITGIYYMIFVYVQNQPRIALLMRDLTNFENFGSPPGLEIQEKRLNSLSNGTFFYAILGTTLYTLVKMSQKSECERISQEKGINENCGFIAPFWMPFRTSYLPVYFLVLSYTFVASQLLMKPSLIMTFNAFEIAEHIILKIKHLNSMIITCFDDDNYEICQNKLRNCILYHQEIVDLALRLDKYFSNGMLTHLAITGIVCACIEKQFVDGDRICAAMHVSGWILTLLLACIAGQLLINASESIPEAIWASKWYQADVRLRKDLCFFLARSQKNSYISVGRFDILSYSLFVKAIKMSYSVLCLLTS